MLHVALSAAEPPPATGLEKRVSALEVVVRRLYLYHGFQARMFQFWGRHAERLMPLEPKSSDASFLQDPTEEDETPFDSLLSITMGSSTEFLTVPLAIFAAAHALQAHRCLGGNSRATRQL